MQLNQEQKAALEKYRAAKGQPALKKRDTGFFTSEPGYEKDYKASEHSFLRNLTEGGGNIIARRGIGLIQGGMELTGLDEAYPETYAASQKAAKALKEQNTGVGGFVGEMVADPVNVALAPAVGGAKTMIQLAGAGAAGGGISGATDAYDETESRTAGTAIGTVAGAVLAPVVATVAKGAGRTVEKTVLNPAKDLVNWARRKLAEYGDDVIAVEAQGGLTPEAIGKAVKDMGDDAKALFRQSIKGGLSKQDAYILAKAEQNGVRLTAGDIKQDPALQRLQDRAGMNMLGDDAYKIARDAENANKAAMRSYGSKLLSDVTGDSNPLTDETSIAATVKSGLENRYQELKQPVQEAYKAGLQTKAKVATDDLVDVPDSIVKRLREDGIDWKAAPNFKKDMQRYGRVFKKIVSKEIPFGAEDEIAGASSRIKEIARADAYGLDESAVDEMAALDFIRKNADFSEGNFLSFLRSKGGLVDDGGELASRGINARTMPGLLRKERGGGGLTLDDAAELAQERGYIQNRDINELLDLVDSQLAGKSVTKIDEAGDLAVKQGLEQAQRILDDSGIDANEALAMYRKNAPKLNAQAEKEIQQLTQSLSGNKPAFSSIPYAKLERLKQNLNSKALWDKPLATIDDYAKRQEILAYRTAAKEMTSKLDDLIVTNALKNPDAAAAELAKAPALNKAFRAAFEKKSPITAIAEKDLTDREVVNVLGSGLIGNAKAQQVVQQMKVALGEESPEIGHLRGLFLGRIFKGALDKGDDATYGTAIKSNIATFKSKNRALYDELFNPSMQQEIDDFAEIAFRQANKVRSKTNPAGSGIETGDLFIKMMDKIGGAGFAGSIMNKVSKEAMLAGDASKAIAAITNPLTKFGADTRLLSTALSTLAPIPASTLPARAGGVLYREPMQSNEAGEESQSQQPSQGRALTPEQQRAIQEYRRMRAMPRGDEMSDIQRHEGLRLASYLDTKGKRTVGVGFNMDSGNARKVWKDAGVLADFDAVYNGQQRLLPNEAQALLNKSHEIAVGDAQSLYPNFKQMSKAQQLALVNLSYNMGKPTLAGFKNMNAAIRKGDMRQAVIHLKNSQYAKDVSPDRLRYVARGLLSS